MEARGREEVHHCLINWPRFVVQPEQASTLTFEAEDIKLQPQKGEVGKVAKAFEIVEKSRIQAQPLHFGTKLRHQLEVIWTKQLHWVEEDSFEAKHWEDLVAGVEVYVSEDVRHDIKDNMSKARYTVQEQRNALWGYALRMKVVSMDLGFLIFKPGKIQA